MIMLWLFSRLAFPLFGNASREGNLRIAFDDSLELGFSGLTGAVLCPRLPRHHRCRTLAAGRLLVQLLTGLAQTF